MIEILDMTDKKIEEMQIRILKQNYEKNRMDEHVYSNKSLGKEYDTGLNFTSYVLVGSSLDWKQRENQTFTKTVSFVVSFAYKIITGEGSISMTVG